MPEGVIPQRSESGPAGANDGPQSMQSSASALVRAVLSARPAALITDIDGTISRIVPRPEDAVVSPAIRQSLEALARRLDLVAVVTGRDQATARQMVAAQGVTYVGNYGLDSEGFEPGLIRAAFTEAGPLATAIPCVQLEDKGVSFALHYRNCQDPEPVRQRLIEELVPVAARYGARVIEGKLVVELVPGSLPDKASAVLNLSRDHDLNGLVYFGDDLGDIPVFEAIRRRREEQALPGAAIAVIDDETDQSVRDAADFVLDGPGAVERLLVELARTL
jgi:trehalose 6-phosphate phosphatase